MNTLEKASPPSSGSNPVAANTKKGQDAAAIHESSEFARSIRGLFARTRPRKIVETGTYLGLGSTLAICHAIYDNGLPIGGFYSIEVNPAFYAQACDNLAGRGFRPHLLSGLSVPRSLLPAEDDIRRETLDQIEDPTVFVDHEPAKRVHYYKKETDFPDALDDLLGHVMRWFDHAPDFVMLDSAGHMGFVEFQYALSLIKAPCYIALDDVYHIKHHRSLKRMQTDGRFKILELSREKFGYCVAHFAPKK